jgi:hypothetical protein
MNQAIDETEYNNEVNNQARKLSDAVEKTGYEPINIIADILNAHSWFSGNELSGADFGAFIEDFTKYDGDVEKYRDPTTLTTGGTFSDILKKMAFAQFEADVMQCYEMGDYHQ